MNLKLTSNQLRFANACELLLWFIPGCSAQAELTS